MKDGWCFSCIVSFLTVSLINGMRGLLLSFHLFSLPQWACLISSCLCFDVTTTLYYFPSNMLAFEGASFGLAFSLLFLFCGVIGKVLEFFNRETFHLIVISTGPRLTDMTRACSISGWP